MGGNLSGTYTVYVVLSNSMYCVGTLLQPSQFPRMYFLVCELCVCVHRVVHGCRLVLVLLAVSSLVSWWSVSSGNVCSVAGRADAVYKDRHSCDRVSSGSGFE